MGVEDRKPLLMDKAGRITLPKKMRDALGFPEGQPWPIWVEAVPSIKEPKYLVITK